jgi:hypothetical protein
MFIAFGGDYYYPRGGWDDFLGTAQTLEDAQALRKDHDWFHVVEIGRGIVHTSY